MRSAGNEGLGTAVSPAAPSGRTASAVEDPRLVRALEEYRAALEAGLHLDRDDFLSRHAEIAPALAECLEGLELVYAVGPPPGFPADELGPAVELPAGGVLGDFRLVQEVGRGGMGIVYEAEQVSLGRHVALKVLPFAATLDPKNLQRFRHEAQAAAHLHHTNIVPVYSVGCERGVHFYAMQFIDGQSLAAVIREMRQLSQGSGGNGPGQLSELAGDLASGRWAPARAPASAAGETTSPVAALATEHATHSAAFFRTAAHLMVQAAEALAYAHAEGIIHRDVKPANLLLSARGTLWVTDFGLARLAKDTGLTRSGDVVGTLRYMSPEQALAKHGLVDHRTDVYSLGATLYQLLTLEPPYASRDREGLLNQIAFEEPRPPRRLRPDLPADLETVALKALAKEPAERYATAQDLADDLRRFLEDKPIRARRPTTWDRARKWVRRHKRVVGVAAALALLALAVLAVSTVLIWRETQKTRAALAEAQENLELTDRALEHMSTQVEKWLAEPHLETLVLDFLRGALSFYEAVAQRSGDDPAMRLQKAKALFRVGSIHYRLGENDKATEATRKAIALGTQLATDYPDVPAYRFQLAISQNNLGLVFSRMGQASEAESAYQQALDLVNQLVNDHPDEPSYQEKQAAIGSNLGLLLVALKRPTEAETALRRAVDIMEKLTEEWKDKVPRRLEYWHGLARSHLNLGGLLKGTRRPAEAETAFRRARDLWEQLVQDEPHSTSYRHFLASSCRHLAALLLHPVPTEEAEQALRRARELCVQLAADFPHVPAYRFDVAMSHHQLGDLLVRSDRREDAEAELKQAWALQEKLMRAPTPPPVYYTALGRIAIDLANVLDRRGDLAEERRLLERTLQHQRTALTSNPQNTMYRHLFLEISWKLADVLVRLGAHAAALEIAAGPARLHPDSGAVHYRVAVYQARCVPLAERDEQLPPEQRQALAQTYAARAAESLRQVVRKGYRDRDALKKNPVFEPLRSRAEFRELLK